VNLAAVSLIIASRNRPQLLIETVISVCESAQMPAQVVVIDQSDNPHPQLMERNDLFQERLTYKWSPASGVSRARNQGVDVAQHPIVLFMDDDMIVTPDWCRVLVSALVSAEPGTVVTGMVKPGEPEVRNGFAPSLRTEDENEVSRGRPGKDVLWTGNMAMYRSDFLELGGFDVRLGPGTAFPSTEDNDFGYRILEAGFSIVYVPGAVLYHRAWRRSNAYYSLRWHYGLGMGAYYAKHVQFRDGYIMKRMGADLAYYARSLPHYVRVDRRRAYGAILYCVGVIVGVLRWLLTVRGPSLAR